MVNAPPPDATPSGRSPPTHSPWGTAIEPAHLREPVRHALGPRDCPAGRARLHAWLSPDHRREPFESSGGGPGTGHLPAGRAAVVDREAAGNATAELHRTARRSPGQVAPARARAHRGHARRHGRPVSAAAAVRHPPRRGRRRSLPPGPVGGGADHAAGGHRRGGLLPRLRVRAPGEPHRQQVAGRPRAPDRVCGGPLPPGSGRHHRSLRARRGSSRLSMSGSAICSPTSRRISWAISCSMWCCRCWARVSRNQHRAGPAA